MSFDDLFPYIYVHQLPNRSPSLVPTMDHKSHAFPMLTHTKQRVPPHSLLSLSLSFHPVCPLLFIHSLPSSPLPLSSHFVFSWFSAWPHLWRRIITKWGHCVLTVIFEVSNSLTFASLFCSGLSVGNLPMFPFSPIVSLSDPHAYIGPHWDWFRNQE